LVVSNARQANQILQEVHSVRMIVGASLRARQHLALIFRAKNTAILRNLQGTELAPILRLMHSCIGASMALGTAAINNSTRDAESNTIG
jgi:chaperone required for assembly of F1-ATPase